MAFDEVRLPDDIERGALGGPRFKTSVIALKSGFEKRNANWEQTRADWDIGYGLRRKSQFKATLKFFYSRFGRERGFRFKDWLDFELDRQSIGLTDGSTATFQIFRKYADADTGVTTLSVDDTNTFSRASGSFVDDGFQVGMSVVGSGFTNGANNATFVLAAVSALTMDVVGTPLAAEVGGGDERIVSTPSFDRNLKKIVIGTESVFVNDAAIAEGAGAGQYQLDDNTGIVTLGSTLAAQSGTHVEVICEFDVPVRFVDDELDMVADTDDASTVPAIPVIEVRV